LSLTAEIFTTLQIDGMECDNCVRSIKLAVEQVPGVISADVSLERETVVVAHGPEATLVTLRTAVEDAGFDVVSTPG
jgi:copper chaperone CopZ